jgi:hypothetical protein
VLQSPSKPATATHPNNGPSRTAKSRSLAQSVLTSSTFRFTSPKNASSNTAPQGRCKRRRNTPPNLYLRDNHQPKSTILLHRRQPSLLDQPRKMHRPHLRLHLRRYNPPSMDLRHRQHASSLQHRLFRLFPTTNLRKRPNRHERLRDWLLPDFQMPNGMDQRRGRLLSLGSTQCWDDWGYGTRGSRVVY